MSKKILFLRYKPFLSAILNSLENSNFLEGNTIDVIIAEPNKSKPSVKGLKKLIKQKKVKKIYGEVVLRFQLLFFKRKNVLISKQLYKKSDIFVLPSKSDSCGLVYLEALSFGVPIIGLTKLFNEFQKNIAEYIGEPFDSNIESAEVLAKKIKLVFDKKFDPIKIHKTLYNQYSWEDNIYKYIYL